MTSIKTLQQKLNEQKSKIGLIGGTVKVVEYDQTDHNISAHITPEGWNIEVAVRKGFNPIQDHRQKAYARKKKIADGLETLVCHVGGLHEPAHWELPLSSGLGCPYDVYNHDRILEGIKRGLGDDKQRQALAPYVANAFEDTIINPRCREFNGDFSGQVLFWDGEGLKCKEEGNKGFTPFYEAFVKLNMHLWGDNSDRALLKRYYVGDKKVENAVANVVKELNLEKGIKDTSVLFTKKNWPRMAEVFAKHLSPLLETPPSERLSAYSQPGQGQGGGNEQKSPSAGNGVERKMGTDAGKEDVAIGRYGSNEKLSPNFTKFEQLDSLYRRLARAIPVRVEAKTKGHDLEIAPLTYRAFNEDTDDITAMKLNKLFVDDRGVHFGHEKQPLVIHARQKLQTKNFPDFKFVIVDDSSSMKDAADGSGNVGSKNSIPWGDRSKYHFALLGVYGIENYLQNQGIAQYIKHGSSVFSSDTKFRVGGYSQLEEVRKLLLSPRWGGTNLDVDVLRGALKDKGSFVLSLSDGEIANWDSVKSDFEKLVKDNYYAHIQVGDRTSFTSDLERMKQPVFYVQSGPDLAKLMVDVTAHGYRRFVRQ